MNRPLLSFLKNNHIHKSLPEQAYKADMFVYFNKTDIPGWGVSWRNEGEESGCWYITGQRRHQSGRETHAWRKKKNKGEVVDKKGRKRSRSRGVVGLMLHGFKSKITLWPGFPSLTQRDKNQLKGAGRTIQHSMFFNEQICVIIIFYCKNIKTSLKLSQRVELNRLH